MPMRSYKVEAVRERASEGGAHFEVVQTLASRTSMGVLAAGRAMRHGHCQLQLAGGGDARAGSRDDQSWAKPLPLGRLVLTSSTQPISLR